MKNATQQLPPMYVRPTSDKQVPVVFRPFKKVPAHGMAVVEQRAYYLQRIADGSLEKISEAEFIEGRKAWNASRQSPPVPEPIEAPAPEPEPAHKPANKKHKHRKGDDS